MIKVYKDVLDRLGIQNVFLTGENNAFCTVLEIGDGGMIWIVTVDKEYFTDRAILNIKTGDTYIELETEIEKLESSLYKLKIKQNKKKKFLSILEKIKDLEQHHEIWEKRKEERFKIGLESSCDFSLSKPEQTMLYMKKEFPCLVNNVSFSGANVTTVLADGSEFKRGNEVIIILKFNNPIEQIALKATIQSVAVKSAKNSSRLKFAIVAVEITNPTLSYRERITQYIKKRSI